MKGSLLSELLGRVGCGQLRPGAGGVWGGHALRSALREDLELLGEFDGNPRGRWPEAAYSTTRPFSVTLTVRTVAHKPLAILGIHGHLVRPDSLDFTLGLAQGPLGTQESEAEGTERTLPFPPPLL